MRRSSTPLEEYIFCEHCSTIIPHLRRSDYIDLPIICEDCIESLEEESVYCDGCNRVIPNLSRAEAGNIYNLCEECDPEHDPSEEEVRAIYQDLHENFEDYLVLEGEPETEESEFESI